MRDIDEGVVWDAGVVRCRLCGGMHVSVHPREVEDFLECPGCGNMTCEPLEHWTMKVGGWCCLN